MDNCILQKIIFIICIIIIIIGIYLAFIREKKNIEKGNTDIQDGGGNIKEGSINFKFAIGLVMIIIGLVGAFYSSENISVCNEKYKNLKSGMLIDSTPTDTLVINKELKTLLFQVAQEQRNNQEYLFNVRSYINRKSDKIPIGQLKCVYTLKLVGEHNKLITKYSYGEEKYIYQLVLKLQNIAELLENYHTRKEYEKWNDTYEMTIDDLAFLTGFLTWYLNSLAVEVLDDSEISSLGWQYLTNEFVPKSEKKNLKMRYFIFEKEPIIDYTEYLGLID